MENGKRKKEVRGMMAGRIFSVAVFCLFITLTSQAQNFWEWSDHFPLTDSLTDNANPVIYQSWNTSQEELLLMFWEKSSDTLSTEIWMDNILDDDPATAILSSAGIHYRHPTVMSARYYPYPDSLFYLFFETDQNGNIDIYQMVYLPDGSFTAPEPFANTPSDDFQLSAGGEITSWDLIPTLNAAAWISEGKLYARLLTRDDDGQHFTGPVIVDSLSCSDPIVSGGEYAEGILYLRSDTSGNHLYESYADNEGNWSAPEVYYDSTPCENPTRTHYYYDPCWSTYIDTSWRIMIKSWNTYELYDISSPSPFDPAVLGVVIGVKSWFPEVWIAIAYPENGMDEIFMTEAFGGTEFQNFTGSNTMNRNPQFFHGESYPYNFYCWYDYLVWESYRNGHWQLWASKVIQCMGDIPEHDRAEAFLSVYPNPFSGQVTVEFTLENRGDVCIEVFDHKGMKVSVITNHAFNGGTHQLRWGGEGLAAGIYLVRMSVDGKIYTAKVMKE